VLRPSAYHSLYLEDLRLSVRLGCTADERATPQEVRVSVEFRFEEAPLGFESDRLDQTVCYAQVSEALKKHIEAREYNLIEKIAADGFRIVKEISGAGTMVSLTAHKVRPPVEGLLGGTKYRCADFPA
jgi:7,8-dihydroneopterin aldolase/epimerase/oxygenase